MKRTIYRLLISVLIGVSTAAHFKIIAQSFIPGNIYFGQNGYIEYHPGNLPIIITAPHGGTIEPSDIPDRTCGLTGVDSRTQTLIREIEYEIFQMTGRYPHIIICRLARKKLDANRDYDEATCGNNEASPYWFEWHKYIDSAKAIVTRQWGKGFYIDLHGHSHDIQRIEWGYLLSSTQLGYSDATLNQQTYINQSSIRNLAGNNVRNLAHSQLIRGPLSIGTLVADRGIPGVPSAQNTSPGVDPYFSGGFNTVRHGSRDGGLIDGVQLEAHSTIRTDHVARVDFSNKLASVILDYLRLHYFTDLDNYFTWNDTDSGISFDAIDVPYVQNFDAVFPGDQTHFLIDNDTQFPGMYAFNTLNSTKPLEFRRYTVGSSTTGNGYLFNAGHSNNPSDRALGLIYSSSTGPLGFGLRFVNNTGLTVTSLDISYTGEQWRVGGSSTSVVPNTLTFDYMKSSRATNIRNGNYISHSALNFTSPNTDPGIYQTAIDGNQAANRALLSSSISVNILPGEEIILRWSDNVDDPGFDHLLAIDDLVVTPRSTMTATESTYSTATILITYPNPVNDILYLKGINIEDCDISVFDLAGRMVMQSKIQQSSSVDVSSLNSGIYIIRVIQAGGIKAGKFIKN